MSGTEVSVPDAFVHFHTVSHGVYQSIFRLDVLTTLTTVLVVHSCKVFFLKPDFLSARRRIVALLTNERKRVISHGTNR